MIDWLEKKRVFPIIFLIIIILEIFSFSAMPATAKVGGTNLTATIYHISIFFLFGFFLFLSIKGNKKLKFWQIFLVIIFIGIYAASDEFHQSFTPGRSCNIEDWLTDTSGALFSVFIYLISYIRKPIQKS